MVTCNDVDCSIYFLSARIITMVTSIPWEVPTTSPPREECGVLAAYYRVTTHELQLHMYQLMLGPRLTPGEMKIKHLIMLAKNA